MNRRHFLATGLLSAALAVLLGAPIAEAQGNYPNQMVRIVVPFSAGSMTDILARAVAERLGAKWNQQVIVENRPGIAGTASMAKAPSDGHTLMLTSNGHTVIKAINPNVSFDPLKDFTAVTQVASMPSILITPPDAPAKTLSELIALAKAKPGALNYGSAGLGSATNIGIEMLRQATGIEMVHVPYKGMPESQTAIIRGDTAMGFTFFNTGGDLIQAGKMRALAVTGSNRLPQLPDVPTFAEAGMPNYDYDAWFGIMVPAGTPRSIVEKVAKDVGESLSSPEMIARFRAQGVDLVTSTPERFDSIVRSDTERYGKLYEKTGG